VRFGLSEQCDVRAKSVVGHGLDGISFRLCAADGPIDVRCPLPGKHHVYAALAAAAVALNAGMSLGEIARALAEARPDLRLTPRRGVNGCTIIDDSYNASPASMIAALDLLSELPGRRVALLGDMRELGSAEDEGHRRAGRRAASACDLLFVTGERAHPLYEAALKAGMTTARYVSAGEAIDALRHELRAGDYLLVKASRAVGLEAVVDALVGR
jgi:UDP-N-acetylmuramoyl-tripeptide--D-alanyl-D-alanine ligase